MNETETRKTTEKINEIKSWVFFFKINKINKLLARLTKEKKRTQTKSETGDITTDTTERGDITTDTTECTGS